METEDKNNTLNIKKEVLNYLEKRNLGVYMAYGYYNVISLDIAISKMEQGKYYQYIYNNKLMLSFSSESFFPHDEHLAIFENLYKNTNINKNYLLENINDLTDGYWKKDIAKTLLTLTNNDDEKKEILLNISNSSLGLNSKNLKQIHNIFKNISKEDKIDFWVKFFSKRKKALNGNKGGTEIHNFLTQYFTKEDIKEHFINLSPYIKDLFENTVDVDIFEKLEKNQVIVSFIPSVVEKTLKIPQFNKKKISFELPRMMNWLSSIMGYKYELIDKNENIKVILSSNERIEDEIFKQTVKDYLVFIKNNNGKVLEDEVSFAKWYSKNKLDNKLIPKEIKDKKLKI